MTTTNTSQPEVMDTDQMSRIIYDGIREIIGTSGIHAAFHLLHGQTINTNADSSLPQLSLKGLAPFQSALEELYGPRGGRGIVQRAGQVSLKSIVRQFGEQMGVHELEYRLLPTPTRLQVGLEGLARTLSRLFNNNIQVIDNGKNWLWHTQSCPWCLQRHGEETLCNFTVGMLQEYFSWASSGRFYSIAEIECLAMGGQACIVEIEKTPLD